MTVAPAESVAETVMVEVGLSEIGFCRLLMRKENYDPLATVPPEKVVKVTVMVCEALEHATAVTVVSAAQEMSEASVGRVIVDGNVRMNLSPSINGVCAETTT